MTYGFDDCTLTAIGTGTTETQLNSGNSLRVPSSARGIVELLPYLQELGSYTTNESLSVAVRVQSDDVAVEPKRFILPVVNTGDASFVGVYCPVLKAYPMNIPLSGFERMNYFAQALDSNASAPGCGITCVYTEGAVGVEQYYQRPDSISTGGTTINTRTAGNDITVTGGGFINALYTSVAVGTSAPSEHIVGFMEFNSSDFQTSMPYRVAVQPSGAGLTANALNITGGAGIMQYNVPGGIPLDANVTINTFYTNRDAVGVGDQFIGCVRYNR